MGEGPRREGQDEGIRVAEEKGHEDRRIGEENAVRARMTQGWHYALSRIHRVEGTKGQV